MPSLASSTARTTNSIWHLGTAGLPAGPGPSFLFLWHCVPPRPPAGWRGSGMGGGVRPWSRQVGFDKADKGNLHASGDIVLGVDLECDQSARLPGQQDIYYNKMGSSLGWRRMLPASSSTCRCFLHALNLPFLWIRRSRFPTSRHKTGSASARLYGTVVFCVRQRRQRGRFRRVTVEWCSP